MKFMTPATLRNLPSYMQEDRQRLLMDREEESMQKAEAEKQAFMNFSVDLLKLGNEVKDPKELNSKLGELAGKYRGILPPTAMQHAAQYVQKWSENFQQQQDKDEKRLLDTQGKASNQALVDSIRGSNSRGGDEFSVPMTDEDYFNPQVMSPEDQMSLLKYREDKKRQLDEDAISKEDRELKRRSTNLQISNAELQNSLLKEKASDGRKEKAVKQEVTNILAMEDRLGGRGTPDISGLSPEARILYKKIKSEQAEDRYSKSLEDQESQLKIKKLRKEVEEGKTLSGDDYAKEKFKYINDATKPIAEAVANGLADISDLEDAKESAAEEFDIGMGRKTPKPAGDKTRPPLENFYY